MGHISHFFLSLFGFLLSKLYVHVTSRSRSKCMARRHRASGYNLRTFPPWSRQNSTINTSRAAVRSLLELKSLYVQHGRGSEETKEDVLKEARKRRQETKPERKPAIVAPMIPNDHELLTAPLGLFMCFYVFLSSFCLDTLKVNAILNCKVEKSDNSSFEGPAYTRVAFFMETLPHKRQFCATRSETPPGCKDLIMQPIFSSPSGKNKYVDFNKCQTVPF